MENQGAPLRVLFMAAEALPYVKIGGLGDVAGSLPRALRNLPDTVTQGRTVDVRLLLPLHPVIRETRLRRVAAYSIGREGRELHVEVLETSLDGLPVYFIDGEPVRTSGSTYSANPEIDAEKYAFFSLAALDLPRQINWSPDVLHANDWHSALVLYASLARRWEHGTRHASSVITVHNLPFQGPDLGTILESYGYPLAQTDLPAWARRKPLPLGLWASDAIVAVSPSYADEILTPEFGSGLDDFLRTRRAGLRGILNGIDTMSFDPSADPAIGATYGADTLDRRATNKGILQERLGLPRDPVVPVMAMVSRMDSQKGIDLAITAMKSGGVATERWQVVILGTGDTSLEDAALGFQQDYSTRARVEIRYDPGLARQIYAGADLLLMPSRYEPCGLSQMIAMRYGCVPLVRAVGGLKDTVRDGETGFTFDAPDGAVLADTIRRALSLYPDRSAWRRIQRAGMAEDFSWSTSARQYFDLYCSLGGSSRRA